MRARLDIVSDERIRDELDKLMVVERPGDGLWFLVDTGLADEFLPELPALRPRAGPDPPAQGRAGPHHRGGREDASPDRLLRLAALFHDVGKPKTRSFGPGGTVIVPPPRGGRGPHDPGPDAGPALLRPRTSTTVSRLVELHLRFHTYRMGWTDSAVRRYVRDAGPLLDQLNELTRCDCTTRNAAKARALARRMDELEAPHRRAARAGGAGGHPARPRRQRRSWPGSGCGPGRAVGEALDFLLELRLDEGPLGEEEAGRRLDAWWAAQQRRASLTARVCRCLLPGVRIRIAVAFLAGPDDQRAGHVRTCRASGPRGAAGGGSGSRIRSTR